MKDNVIDYRKQEIADELSIITSNYNDEELDYAIWCMQWWQEERQRQDKEIEELYEGEQNNSEVVPYDNINTSNN